MASRSASSPGKRPADGACAPGQPPSHWVHFGASGQMGYKKREQGGESRGRVRVWVYVCCLCPPMRWTCHPETPTRELPHTSLGCQDNGQQASAVTPHFLCTELSNHDRCRQCRRRRHQGPQLLPAFLAKTIQEQAEAIEYPRKGIRASLRHLWHVRHYLSCLVVYV